MVCLSGERKTLVTDWPNCSFPTFSFPMYVYDSHFLSKSTIYMSTTTYVALFAGTTCTILSKWEQGKKDKVGEKVGKRSSSRGTETNWFWIFFSNEGETEKRFAKRLVSHIQENLIGLKRAIKFDFHSPTRERERESRHIIISKCTLRVPNCFLRPNWITRWICVSALFLGQANGVTYYYYHLQRLHWW